MPDRRTRILAIDTGGTMTDTILIDQAGDFIVGKAQTTPDSIGDGIMRSVLDAAARWGLEPHAVFKGLELVVYTGTLMLNRVLSRTGGGTVGVITSSGFEDVLRFGRARQSWQHLSLPEHLHAVSHFHPEPLVERSHIKGVRERVLQNGLPMVALYEEDVRAAAEELLDAGVDAIVIAYLNSFGNPEHELRSADIVQTVLRERGAELPVYLSHRIHPIMGEAGRLNAVVIQVYAAEPSRLEMRSLGERFRDAGSDAAVRLLTNYGTVVSTEHEQLIHTVNSAPTGGLLGTKFMGDLYDQGYMLATDVGGTTFDVGLTVNHELVLRDAGLIGRYWVNLPMVAVDSIGAGTGSYVRVDPVTDRVRLGPDSAGYRVGVCWPEGDVETVTANDADLILGYLNPDNFLGGQLRLDPERARDAFRKQIAEPLGVGVHEAAWGVYRLANLILRLHLQQVMLGMGFGAEVFQLVAFGGGAPLHVAGYTDGLDLAGVMVPSWAAGFSAFGAACGEYGVRQETSTDVYIGPGEGVKAGAIAEQIMRGVYANLPAEVRGQVDGTISQGASFEAAMTGVLGLVAGGQLGAAWARLREAIERDARREGLDPGKLRFEPKVKMRYAGMLDDVEVSAPGTDPGPELLAGLVHNFEQTFDKVYARGARSSEFGYQVGRAILTGYHESVRPQLVPAELSGPGEAQVAGARRIWWDAGWHEAPVHEMSSVPPGSTLIGPCVVEDPATTLIVPPGYRAYLDRFRVFRLVRPGEDLGRYEGR